MSRQRIFPPVFYIVALTVSSLLLTSACEKRRTLDEIPAVSTFQGLTAIDRSGRWDNGKKGGRFVVASTGNGPKSFNGAVAQDDLGVDIVELLYRTAFRRNQFTYEWQNDLAESWTLSDDNLELTVKLRSELRWSDGEAFTANDIVFTVNEIHMVDDTESRFKKSLKVGAKYTKWELVDELTFKIILPSAYADPFDIATTLYLPKHIFEPLIENGGAEAVTTFWGVGADVTTVVGNGPFVIKEYVPNQYISMKPNPYYHVKDDNGVQLPYVGEFVYLLLKDRDAFIEKFIAGDLNFLELQGGDFSALVHRQVELDFTLYEVGPGSTSNFIAINQNPKESEEDGGITDPQLSWLQNLEFRRALAHLVDRETIINTLVYGLAYPIFSFVPSTSDFYWKGQEDAAPKYGPAKAEAILDRISFVDRDDDGIREDPEGNKISLVIRTNAGNSVREGMIENFAAEARSVGLDIAAESEEYDTLVTRLVESYDWELIAIGLTSAIDPGLTNLIHPSSGELHMIEPFQVSPRRDWEADLDKLWGVNLTTTDIEVRKKKLIEAQKIWLSELPVIYIFSVAVMHAYGNEWRNIYPQSFEGYDLAGILERVYRVD